MISWTNTNHVEWSIRARSAVDSAQWDLGIINNIDAVKNLYEKFLTVAINLASCEEMVYFHTYFILNLFLY